MDINNQAAKLNRFTMLIKEISSYGSQTGIKGKPFGEYSDADELFISKSNMPVVKIKPSFSKKEGDMLEIIIDGDYLPDNAINAVVTNIEPQAAVDVNKPIENPFLLALAREYKDNYKDREYTNEFCYNLVHAKYVVPVVSDELGTESGAVKKGTQVGFPMLNINGSDKKVLPTFTDWGAFSKWTAFTKQKGPVKVLVLKFDDIADIASQSGEGFVINPFSEPVPVPPQFIESIRNSEGYKSEKNVTKRTIKQDTTVKIGTMKETEKTRLVKEALTDLGKRNDLIKEIYLFAKQENNEEANIIAVFDLDFSVTEDERKKIFDEAYRVIVPCLGREMKVEFAMKAPTFIKICSNYEPFYKA